MPQTVYFHWISAMAVVLLGYFSTMVTVLAALMFLLNSFLTSPLMQRPRPRPYLAPAVEQTAAQDKQPGSQGPPVIYKAADGAMAATAGDPRFAAEKNKQLKLARVPQRKDVIHQPDEQPGSIALSYNQEPPQQPAAPSIFNVIAPHR
jgi:hypothetical protein